MLFFMAAKDKTTGMKSAYELALERMEKQGIERPREETFSDERGSRSPKPAARPKRASPSSRSSTRTA